jgi:hypothetical protein
MAARDINGPRDRRWTEWQSIQSQPRINSETYVKIHSSFLAPLEQQISHQTLIFKHCPVPGVIHPLLYLSGSSPSSVLQPWLLSILTTLVIPSLRRLYQLIQSRLQNRQVCPFSRWVEHTHIFPSLSPILRDKRIYCTIWLTRQACATPSTFRQRILLGIRP